MADQMNGSAQLLGDGGNPSGTGIATLKVFNLESADAATGLADMDTFADSLKTGNFTGCNVGDVACTIKDAQYQEPPAAGINIDRQLVVSFKNKDEIAVRKLTIPGIAAGAAVVELVDGGERITAAAKTTLEGYLDTLFGWTDKAVVIKGKVVQKT